jgi:hypothetical protein
LGAIARGWCHEKNANKEMDSDLAMAIATEVKTLYATPPQLEDRNFCPRCGKRTKDIHTCTPPQRTWVGLTDEEIKKISKKHKWHESNVAPHLMPVFRSLEAKLKEKNT